MSIDISDTFKSFFKNTNHREKSEHRAKRLKDPKIYYRNVTGCPQKMLCPVTNLPLAQTIFIVCFCGPNATIARVSSGSRNWASDHSELKYFGNTPANM